MAEDRWEIRGVPEATRRKIRAYAAANGLTLAEAITKLAELAEK